MTAKEVLQKVKSIFNEAPVAAAAPVPAPTAAPAGVETPYKLADGTEISIAQLSGPDPYPGDVVTIGGVPAPAGELVLEDGSTLVVGEAGVISEVKPVEPVTTDIPVEQAAPTVEERLAKIEEALAKLTAPAMPTGLATEAQLQAATEKIEKQDKVIEGLFELAEKLAETPTAEPKTLTGNKKDQFERTIAKEKKIEGIATAITQLKNKNK